MSHSTPLPDLYVLAGGRSSRFGSDKARASIGDTALITHVVRQLQPVARSVTAVAAEADKYADLGLRTIPDRSPGQGPLAGLQAALHDGPIDRWILLVSCDFAAADACLVKPLLDAIVPGAPAVAYRAQRWEPLLALYHRSLRAEVDWRLSTGRLAMQRLLDEVGAVAVETPDDWPALTSVNTPQELADFLCRRSALRDTLGANGPEEKAMRLQVLLFGPAANAAGARSIEVNLPAPATVANLRTAIGAAHPALEKFLPPSRLAVNHEFAAEDRVLQESDEIALIGMVSGG